MNLYTREIKVETNSDSVLSRPWLLKYVKVEVQQRLSGLVKQGYVYPQLYVLVFM
jgi:hypothetical protein